jgi:OHCU decarboxylase
VRANPAEYDLVSPGSLDGVLALLAEQPGRWTPIAGGTELMVQFGAGRLQARRLVNIFGLPELMQISVSDEAIRIGAGVTYTAIRNQAEIAATLPLLARAASWTGSIANQNRGTLGGNIVNGSPAADSPPALLAYEASLELISVRGTRIVPYADFHTGYKQTLLAPDELVLAVIVPKPSPGVHQYLRKVGPRNAMAISKVELAAVAALDGAVIRAPRLGLASVAHAPYRCRQTEAVLNDQPLTAALIAKAQAALVAEIAPLDDIRSTARYRTQVATNLLQEFLGQLRGSSSPLAQWNALEAEQALANLLACCGSRLWAETLAAQRPFASPQALIDAAEALWFSLAEADWLEAFAAHPRIGERKAPTTDYLASSASEQATAQQTLDTVAEALLTNNRMYEQRFGFRYIVFASGRTAPELLAVLEARLGNTREQELHEAARQQLQITNLRLRKWLQP